MEKNTTYEELQCRNENIYSRINMQQTNNPQAEILRSAKEGMQEPNSTKKKTKWNCKVLFILMLILSLVAIGIFMTILYLQKSKQLEQANQDLLLLNHSFQSMLTQTENLQRQIRQKNTEFTELSKRKQIEPCPSDWKQFRLSCYFYYKKSVTWATARRMCQDLSSELVVITNAEEQTFFIRNNQNDYWIGLTDEIEEGVWRWVDGTIQSKSSGHWCKNEPNNAWGNNPNSENCAIMWDSCQSKWNDEDCQSLFHFICEKPTRCSLS